jgi:hypothetical protein
LPSVIVVIALPSAVLQPLLPVALTRDQAQVAAPDLSGRPMPDRWAVDRINSSTCQA